VHVRIAAVTIRDGCGANGGDRDPQRTG